MTMTNFTSIVMENMTMTNFTNMCIIMENMTMTNFIVMTNHTSILC